MTKEDTQNYGYFVDSLILRQLMKVKDRVLKKDRDFVGVYDGEEGVGKSVLAMQHAKILDPEFDLDKVVFTSDAFIKIIKDPKTKKGACILLDEAMNAANARGSLTEVNRAMIALASEMRQKNLFVLIVIPSFFDLDKYFALWRTRVLFHLYFTDEEERRFVVFDKRSKKDLYIHGKKKYDYSWPKATFPPSKWYNTYIVDEKEYRLKKAAAFQKRTVSNQARNWLLQRNALIKHLIRVEGLNQIQLNDLLKQYNVQPLSSASLSMITAEIVKDSGGEIEVNVINK